MFIIDLLSTTNKNSLKIYYFKDITQRHIYMKYIASFSFAKMALSDAKLPMKLK